jgi:hypothetical protein
MLKLVAMAMESSRVGGCGVHFRRERGVCMSRPALEGIGSGAACLEEADHGGCHEQENTDQSVAQIPAHDTGKQKTNTWQAKNDLEKRGGELYRVNENVPQNRQDQDRGTKTAS